MINTIRNKEEFKTAFIKSLRSYRDTFSTTDSIIKNNRFYVFLTKFEKAQDITTKYDIIFEYYNDINFNNYVDLFTSKQLLQFILDNYDESKVSNEIDLEKVFIVNNSIFKAYDKYYKYSIQRYPRHASDVITYEMMVNSIIREVFLKLYDYNPIDTLPHRLHHFNIDWEEVKVMKDNINLSCFNSYRKYYDPFRQLIQILPENTLNNPKDTNYLLKKCIFCCSISKMVLILRCIYIPECDSVEEYWKQLKPIITIGRNYSDSMLEFFEKNLSDKSITLKIFKVMEEANVSDDVIKSVIKSIPDIAYKDSEEIIKTLEYLTEMEKQITIYNIEFLTLESKKYISVINADFTIAGIYSGRVDASEYVKTNKNKIIDFLLYKIKTNGKYATRLKHETIAPIQFYKISDLRINAATGDCQMKLSLKEV